MTALVYELHGRIHFPIRLVAAFAVLGAVAVLLGMTLLARPTPAPVDNYYGCPPEKADCELQWMLENLTQIEHPMLILTPGDF